MKLMYLKISGYQEFDFVKKNIDIPFENVILLRKSKFTYKL
ncbi:hypothetical protein FHS10_003928 [Mucilaginibacter dorajii]|nr:hypothetical protein [Mucilaginibacter dorajii]